MTIARRLTILVTIALVFPFAVGAYALTVFGLTVCSIEAQANPSAAEQLATLMSEEANLRAEVYRALEEGQPDRSPIDEAMNRTQQRAQTVVKSWQANMATRDAHELGDGFLQNLNRLKTAEDQLGDAVSRGDFSKAREIVAPKGAFSVSFADARADAERYATEQRNEADIKGTLVHASWGLVLALGVGLAFVSAFGIKAYRIVTRALNGMRMTFEGVSETMDLSAPAPVRRQDEIGAAARAFNKLLYRVSETVREVRAGAESVSAGSREIAAGNADLSARTELQATALEQTTASMKHLMSAVRQNVDTAHAARNLSMRAAEISEHGGQVVERMIATMDDITRASRRIGEITSLIEGIAFQTNILALNAAVEAARAGDQGRGFGVVASEVRNLAQRSATAAKEIKELIAGSGETIQRGASEARDAGEATSSMRDVIQQVATLIGEIALASEEQSTGIEQVNIAIVQMDRVTVQNAALVQQAAAAAQLLESESSKLSDTVSVFKIAVAPAQDVTQGSDDSARTYSANLEPLPA
ncbi:methyl-accepting chemotaxis protein [Paraburkholderia lycopersici]|uniref:Methyl-accepting chemotaxis protein n=1 Tax=Paraburkholderia lycopersici TaxID=416944 RepID=A0A1G6LZY5_9BURK|nr:methyl-accepting chemotaxis protein [Paraburkholderia lycopersici]SDC48266.1 methyl-accepting chemotaxis protein [Paraburkholderia lycopersici]